MARVAGLQPDHPDQRGDVITPERVLVAGELIGIDADGVLGPDGRASVARARCSELATATVVVPSTWAASSDRQRSTSHKIRAARWRAGSWPSAAASALRTPSCAPTMCRQ
jgi:hypothetical protein